MIQVEENKISTRRIAYFILLGIVFAVGTVVLAWKNEILMDQLLCSICLDVFFLMVFIGNIMHKRLSEQLTYSGTSYFKIFICVSICWGICIFNSFLPEFFAFIVIMALILTSVLDGELSLALSIYFDVLFCLSCDCGIYVLICYLVLSVLTSLAAMRWKHRETKRSIFDYLTCFVIQCFVTVVFYYITYHSLDLKIMLYTCLLSVINCIFLFFVFPKLIQLDNAEKMNSYLNILDPEYSLVEDIRRFSLAEYEPGRKVSQIARKCAHTIGANELCCACGGFYYRIGRMEGEPVVANGVKIAIDHCFPIDVVAILSEYAFLEKKPQSIESAIVHMVDALITKIELLDFKTISTDWNQDMLIYQTLNELSAEGLYDESKLSMNQFLKIRDYLVKEDLL